MREAPFMKISPFTLISSLILALTCLLSSTQALAARNEHRPVCSPDGSKMIYMLQSERTDDDWELYILDMDKQVRSRLTSHAGWDGYAVWSPDGARIVFDREDEPGKQKHPWIMDLNERTLKPLGRYEGWMSISDWSGDNRLLGFHEIDGQRDLVILNLEGQIVENITATPIFSEHDAHFSPDGSKIAYANGAVDGSETSLEIIDLESGDKFVLRTSIGRIYGISWSLDGEKIAFVDAPGGDDDADIFIHSIADNRFRQVTDDPSWDHMPEFCHSSETLLFTSYRSGEERIYQIDLAVRPFLKVDRAGDQ
jgi:Tol biopolymer transport system component